MSIDPISDPSSTSISTLDDSLQTLQNNNTDETDTAQNGALAPLASATDQPGNSDAAVVSLNADGSQSASQQTQTYGRAHGKHGGHHHGGHHKGGGAEAAQNGQNASSSLSTASTTQSADDDISAQLGATEQIAD